MYVEERVEKGGSSNQTDTNMDHNSEKDPKFLVMQKLTKILFVESFDRVGTFTSFNLFYFLLVVRSEMSVKVCRTLTVGVTNSCFRDNEGDRGR